MNITVHEDLRLFELRTERTTYLFGLNEKGILHQLHWGEPVVGRECARRNRTRHNSSFEAEVERENEEFSFWGGAGFMEPGLKVRFADGVRDLRMRYEGYRLERDGDREVLVLTLRDASYPLAVRLHYRLVPGTDLIERYASAENEGEASIVLERFHSAAWSIPYAGPHRLTHVAGRWAGEFQLRETMLSEGKKVLESRMGFTAPHANPWFAIDDGSATEAAGSVWFGLLGWSGNWSIVAEKSTFGNVRVSGGLNDFDSELLLEAGQSFTTPMFVGGYTDEGFGGMSRMLHRYERERVLPTGAPRRILYNSWEATYFDVRAESQLELARKAAKLGVERFVVDDGWFGARGSDRAGLGDWTVNPAKFPDGLASFIHDVQALGMDFGIWVEPESVNPDSELYRRHPDWVYGYPTREGTQLRNQLLLNVSKPEVKQYILGFMTKLLSEHPISFIKWDMNRPVTEPGMAHLPPERQKEVWVRHVETLYAIWEELRGKFPHVEFETCAGGGSRIDLGILRFADQAWPSDNTDAFDRLTIQEGFTYAYTPRIMMCWVTDSPNGVNGRRLPLAFRFRSAMTGSLGIGGNLKEWTEAELTEAAAHIAEYKEVRPLVQTGDQYRLASLRHAPFAAVQYVGEDRLESVVFAFLHSQQFGGRLPDLRLRGLDRDTVYEVSGIGSEPFNAHGSTLMHAGIPLPLRGDFDSLLVRIRAVQGGA